MSHVCRDHPRCHSCMCGHTRDVVFYLLLFCLCRTCTQCRYMRTAEVERLLWTWMLLTKTRVITVTSDIGLSTTPTTLSPSKLSLWATSSTTHTHPFNGPLSGTAQVSRYQKGKINLDFTEARDSEWQWHQLGYMQVCTSLQTDSHASTSPQFFTGQMLFLPPNQQHQSTEATNSAVFV